MYFLPDQYPRHKVDVNPTTSGEPNSDFGSTELTVEAKTTGPGAPVYADHEVRQQTRKDSSDSKGGCLS